MNYIEELKKQMEEDLPKIKKWFPKVVMNLDCDQAIMHDTSGIIVSYDQTRIKNDYERVYKNVDFNVEDVFEEVGDNLTKLKIKEPKIRRTPIGWTPEVGEKYYYLDAWSGIQEDVGADMVDPHRVFKYKEEAENQSKINDKINKINKRINELNEGWEPDWKDGDDEKINIYFDFSCNKIKYYYTLYWLELIKINPMKNLDSYVKIREEFEEDLIDIFKWEARI